MRTCKIILTALFLLELLTVPQGALANHAIKIPHWIELVCTPMTPGQYGYPGCGAGVHLRWAPIEGATSYYVDDLFGGYDSTHPHPTDDRGLGGCGPCGGIEPACCKQQTLEFNQDYSYNYSRYEVYAIFPDGTGNLEVSKKSNVTGIVYPGDTIGYTLSYKNIGTAALSDVEIIETLPAHIEFVSGGTSHSGQEVRWNIGTLSQGQQGSVTLQVKIDKSLPSSIDRIYNVAVSRHDEGTTPTVVETTNPVGADFGLCDSFVAQMVHGNVEWTEFPAPDYKDLQLKDNILGQDHVRANTGMATFDHTIIGGALVLSQGGFTPRLCNQLDYPVISEFTLDDDSSIQHSVGGILNADEHALVHSKYLTLNIHDGDYSLTSSGGAETVHVTRGKATVIDPNNASHVVMAGQSFSWPNPPISPGPQVTATSPKSLQSLDYRNFAITYVFDQPVTSLSGDSLFLYSMACNLYTLSGTFDSLAGSGLLAQSWNGSKTELTLTLNNSNPYTLKERYHTCDVTVTTQLKDVEGASSSSGSLTTTLHLFNAATTTLSGAISTEFNNIKMQTHEYNTFGGGVPYTLQVVTPPGALPSGMRLLSPVYQVHIDGSVAHPYYVALKTTAPERMTCSIGGGVYTWQNQTWQQLKEGLDSDWNGMDVSSGDVTIALLAKSGDPQIPEIVFVSHTKPTDQITPSNPLVIRVKGPFGLDLQQTDVIVGGKRIWAYDPAQGIFPNWTVSYSGDIATLTYAPPTGWSHSTPLYGFVKVAGSYGSLTKQANIGSSTDFPWGMFLPAITHK